MFLLWVLFVLYVFNAFCSVPGFYIFIINDLDSIVNILKFDEPKISNACVVNKKQNKCTTTHLISMLILWYERCMFREIEIKKWERFKSQKVKREGGLVIVDEINKKE